MLAFDGWEVVGGLRGNSYKSRTGEAISPGSGESKALAGGNGSTSVVWVFLMDVYSPPPGLRFLRAAGPLRQKEPLCLVEGQEQRRRGDGWSKVSGGEDGVWSTGEQGLP